MEGVILDWPVYVFLGLVHCFPSCWFVSEGEEGVVFVVDDCEAIQSSCCPFGTGDDDSVYVGVSLFCFHPQ